MHLHAPRADRQRPHNGTRVSVDEPAPVHAAAQPSDSDLARAVQRGDAQALDVLLLPRLPWALRAATRLTRSRPDAEDLVQEACLRVIEQIHHFPHGGRFDAWFARLLYNLAYNRTKAARVRDAIPLQDDVMDRGHDALQATIDRETRERFDAAVRELPPRQKVIVMMFEVEGYSSVEIASVLAVSAETVRWHLHAARKTLRSILRPVLLSDDPDVERA